MNLFLTGGAQQQPNGSGYDYNTYEMDVFPAGSGMQPDVYFLNSVDNNENPHTSGNTQHLTFPISYSATIKVYGGGKIVFTTFDSNCTQVMNCGTKAQNAGNVCTSHYSVPLTGTNPAAADHVHAAVHQRNWVAVRAVGLHRRYRPGGRAVIRQSRLQISLALAFAGCVLIGRSARAEITLSKTDGGWDFYTEGRLGAFFETVQGDGFPDGFDHSTGATLHSVGDGGLGIAGDSVTLPNGVLGNGSNQFLPHTKRILGEHLGVWAPSQADREHDAQGVHLDLGERRDEQPAQVPSRAPGRAGRVPADIRPGRLPLGRPCAGPVLARRDRDRLPVRPPIRRRKSSRILEEGPADGQIGYGVLAASFSPGIVYATPVSWVAADRRILRSEHVRRGSTGAARSTAGLRLS